MRAIKRGVLAVALFGAVAVGTWAYSPGVARAEAENPGLGVAVLGAEVVFGIPAIVFVSADIVYGVQSSWLPPGWAGWQLGLGGVPQIGLGVAWAVLDNDLGIVMPIAHFVLGTWFLTHSILSFVLYEPSEYEAGDKPKPTASIDLGITPVEGGAVGSLFGSF